MNTVINLSSFKGRFVSGLLFSLIEGLQEGEVIVVRSVDSLEDFLREITLAGLEDLCFDQAIFIGGHWELTLKKVPKSGDTLRVC